MLSSILRYWNPLSYDFIFEKLLALMSKFELCCYCCMRRKGELLC